jgi:phage terminase large subunit-like protein
LIGKLTSDEHVNQLIAEGRPDQQFNYINIPAILEEGETDVLNRGANEALFPEERPLSYLQGIKATIPAYEWDSQYRGKPRSVSSSITDLSNLKYVRMSDVPWDNIDEIVRGWDTALSEEQTADYTAGALLGYDRKSKTLYVLNMVRRRLAWAKMRSLITLQAEVDLRGYPQAGTIATESGEEPSIRVLRMGMEGVGGFKGVVEDVRDALIGRVKVELKNPPKRSEGGGSKLLRAQSWLNKVEAGQVVVVQAEWTKDFIDELDTFPDGKHDDQMDAVSVAWEMLEKRGKLLLA